MTLLDFLTALVVGGVAGLVLGALASGALWAVTAIIDRM